MLLFLALAACTSAVLPRQSHGKPHSLLYHELNLATTVSKQGLGLSDQAPQSFVGFEFFQKYPSNMPGQFSIDALDLYTGLSQTIGGRLRPQIEEAWIRFADPGADTRVKIGRLRLPYGLSPTLDLRGLPLLPLLDVDFGSLREWGISLDTHARGFVYEAATSWTLNSNRRRSARHTLLSGRVGVPAFRDIRYGFSALYGPVRAPESGHVNAWRLSADAVYNYHEPYTMLAAEVSFGRDGSLPVWGLLARWSHIFPEHPNWQLLAQSRRWHHSSKRTNLAAEHMVGFGKSLPYLLTLRVLLIRSTLQDQSVMAQLHYYAP